MPDLVQSDKVNMSIAAALSTGKIVIKPLLSVAVRALQIVVVTAVYVPSATAQELQAAAQPTTTASEKPANKLTLGGYHFSETGNAFDINLRHTNDFGDTWLGYYNSARREEHQGRVGWDNTFETGPIRITPSAQLASRGYFAWSANIEAGNSWFVGAGFGRTNLKPNWNLNFDPNDSYSLSAGRRSPDGESIAFQWVRDDRENPDQRHLHAVYRKPLAGGERVTIDLLRKQGLVDDVMIHRLGASFTYDWRKFFIRLAYDPKVNFTSENMARLVVGTRF